MHSISMDFWFLAKVLVNLGHASRQNSSWAVQISQWHCHLLVWCVFLAAIVIHSVRGALVKFASCAEVEKRKLL